MTLAELINWVQGVPGSLPEEMRPMAESICEAFESTAKRLMDLGLGYLTLDRAASTLSTGERQRMQLARAVRNRTTGVLYVLDEPSIGLHPSNIVGLTGVMHDLVADGNSVILVDHDTQILKEADWIVEMGPEAGAKGGYVIAEGTIPAIEKNPVSQIGPFLSGAAETKLRQVRAERGALCQRRHSSFDRADPYREAAGGAYPQGAAHRCDRRIRLRQDDDGAGKPRPRAGCAHRRQDAAGAHPRRSVRRASRTSNSSMPHPSASTSAPRLPPTRAYTTSCARLYAQSADAKERGYKPSDFSYNTGALRCPGCDGTGVVSLDVQFLPDVNIPCPDCRGSRYARKAYDVKLTNKAGASASLPELMDMDVNSAMEFCKDRKAVCQKLGILRQLGLGYLTLGEETPSLSGGEAQRLKLASEIGKTQTDSVFVFDEPSIGLHPLDVRVLLGVFQALLDNGATVIVIEHDLDVIRNADYVIDMGPGGGDAGGRIVAVGTPQEIRADENSITGRYL